MESTHLKDIAEEIISLKNKDLAYRDHLIQEGTLGDGYNSEMEKIHLSNASRLEEIIDSLGFPTTKRIGKEAREAAWLIIQHSISRPAFMKKCEALLVTEVNAGDFDPILLAYLSDRIAVYEGRLQSYGTQFDWDADGQLSPQPYDNLALVNDRRKSIGLNTMEEQTSIMRKRALEENQNPPSDLKEHQKEYDIWREKVGWI